MYDEDNVDLEEQLYLQEVQEELDAEEAALEELEEEEYDPTDYTLTKSFLIEQLKKKESERINIKVVHKKTGKIFEGIVLGQGVDDPNKFAFRMSIIENEKRSEPKTKIFNFADIRKY